MVLFLLYVYVYFACMCACAPCVCRYLQKPQEAVWAFSTGVADGWKPPDVVAGKETQVPLWKQYMLLNIEPLIFIFLLVN